MVVLGGGLFLMSEVPLYQGNDTTDPASSQLVALVLFETRGINPTPASPPSEIGA